MISLALLLKSDQNTVHSYFNTHTHTRTHARTHARTHLVLITSYLDYLLEHLYTVYTANTAIVRTVNRNVGTVYTANAAIVRLQRR